MRLVEEKLIRSTPTHVGNTRVARVSFMRSSVHPHARGEYDAENEDARGHSGPPPRTWGIHKFAPIEVATGTVHPHARGEYSPHSSSVMSAGGPPPRTWGIRKPRNGFTKPGRSTPTHVGNTRFAASRSPDEAVHPHARGEYMIGVEIRPVGVGPPPRTWGILVCLGCGHDKHRSTPTHVGNTADA